MHKKCLLAIPNFCDPTIPIAQDQRGPILQALYQEHFDSIALFQLNPWSLNYALTEQALRAQFPHLTIQKYAPNIASIASHKAIFYPLRDALNVFFANNASAEIVGLLPPPIYDRLLDCWLLLLLTGNRPVRILQLAFNYPQTVHQSAPEDDALALHDASIDPLEAIQLTPMQIRYLYQQWSASLGCHLWVPDATHQRVVAQTFNQYVQVRHQTHRSVACNDIPEELSNFLLFGTTPAATPTQWKPTGILNQPDAWISLTSIDSFAETLQSSIVAFLTKTRHHFMVLSSNENTLLQLPQQRLPMA